MSTRVDANYTMAIAFSYAIAALKDIPADWREDDELKAMETLFANLVPHAGLRETLLDVSQGVLNGRGMLRERPRLDPLEIKNRSAPKAR